MSARRPLPALVFLLALLLLSGLVWWRVVHRVDSAHPTQAVSPTCTTRTTKPVALPSPKSVQVTVLNSTGKANLATTVSGQLRAKGFRIARVGNDPKAVAGVAEIRYGPKAVAAARLTQIYLPGSTLVPNSGTSAGVVVSLGGKYTSLATDAQVARGRSTPPRQVRVC